MGTCSAAETHHWAAHDVAGVVHVHGVVAQLAERLVRDVELDDAHHQLPVVLLRLERQAALDVIGVAAGVIRPRVREDRDAAQQLPLPVAVAALHVVCKKNRA